MRSLMIAAAAALILGAGSIPASAFTSVDHGAAKAGAGDVTPAASTKHRPRYDVRVPRQYRGFEDPGYAYHGNINGCAVDLGYGRWESCNVGR